MHGTLPAVLLLLAATAAAQTKFSLPGGLEASPGATQQVVGWNGPERIQSIYSPAVLPAGPNVITHVRLRSPAVYTAPAMVVNVTLTLASTGVPLPEHASESSFAANRGSASQATVLTGVTLPAVTPTTPTFVDLPLAAPFLRPAGQPLLVELDVTVVSFGGFSPKWATQVHEFPSQFWDPTEQVLGNGCVAGDMATKVAASFPPREEAVWKFFGSQPAGTPAVLLLGLSDQHYGVLPLPIDLAYLGAPGCSLYVSVDAVQLTFGITTAWTPHPTMFGGKVLLPRHPSFAGTRISGQFAILDPGHNAAGFAMTPYARFDLVTPPTPERMRYSHSFLAPGWPQDAIQTWLPDRALVFDVVAN
jgi:hypothetical protein